MHTSKILVVATIVVGACTSQTTNDLPSDAILEDAAAQGEFQDADGGPSEENTSRHPDAKHDSATALSGSVFGELSLVLFDYQSLFVSATFDHESSDEIPKDCAESKQGDCRMRICPENSPGPAAKTMWPHAGRIDISTEEVTLPSLLPGDDGKYQSLMKSHSLGIQSRKPARFAAQGHGDVPAFTESVDVPQRIVLSLPKAPQGRTIKIPSQGDAIFEWPASTGPRDFFLNIWKGKSFLRCIVPVETGKLSVPATMLSPFKGGGASFATAASRQSTHGKLNLKVYVFTSIFGPDLRPIYITLE